MSRDELGQRMDELARRFAETHDPKVKRELEEISLHIARLDTRNAFMVLIDALNRCRDEDIRTPEVFAALECLESRARIKWPFDQFRRSMDIHDSHGDPEGRWQNLHAR
jgi:hypothetical protein